MCAFINKWRDSYGYQKRTEGSGILGFCPGHRNNACHNGSDHRLDTFFCHLPYLLRRIHVEKLVAVKSIQALVATMPRNGGTAFYAKKLKSAKLSRFI